MSAVTTCSKCGASLTAVSAACPRCSAAMPGPTATQSLPVGLPVPMVARSTPRPSAGTTDPQQASHASRESELPARIGRFVVRRWVGEGSFAEVYLAYDPQLDREVALKVAKPGTLGTPRRIKRFLREARSAGNLRHPNIVPLYETGEDGGRHFLVSSFIRGRTLGAILDDVKASGCGLPLNEAASIIRRLAEALAYAHGEGVVHRDIKPENIMVDDKREPLLMDFGLASRASPEDGEERLTQEGVRIGTPAYMAPEQAKADQSEVSSAADQYALGCTLFELFTGRTPFAGPPEVQLLLHQTQPPPSPRKQRKDVPRDLETICLKCLEKEPGKRYPDCQAVADDLRRWLDGETISARRPGPVERLVRWTRRNPAVASLLATVVAVSAIGAIVSSSFAVNASWQASQAQENERAAVRAKEELETANGELLGTTARGLLMPIGLHDSDDPNEFVPLTEVEARMFWELSMQRNGPIGKRYIEEAARVTFFTRQLRNRSAYVLHALVGLDPGKRDEFDALFRHLIEMCPVGNMQRTDLALAVSSLGALRPETAAKVTTVLVEAAGLSNDKQEKLRYSRALVTIFPCLPREEAERACGLVTEVVLRELESGTNFNALAPVVETLIVLAPWMAHREAAQVANRVSNSLSNSINLSLDPLYLRILAVVLKAVSPDGDIPDEKKTTTEAIGPMPVDPTNSLHPPTPSEAALAAEKIIGNLSPSSDPDSLLNSAKELATQANWVNTRDAERYCVQMATTLTQKLIKTSEPVTMYQMSSGLCVIAPWLAPRDAEQIAERLGLMLGNHSEPEIMGVLADAIGSLASRMSTEKAARLCGEVSRVLGRGIRKGFLMRLGVSGIPTPGLQSNPAVSDIPVTEGSDISSVLTRGFVALAPWLAPSDSVSTAEVLLLAMSQTADPVVRGRLGGALLTITVPKCAIRPDRSQAPATAVGSFAALSLLSPRRFSIESSQTLPPQALIDILKHPLCVGLATRITLDALELRFGRKFPDMWGFVQYAHESQLGFDFTSQPPSNIFTTR
jgi:serine/threonine protein kinase